jgi:hypothetical protein
MALPMKGTWAARAIQPSANELVWGTGINPVHYEYGSPAARLSAVRPLQGMSRGEGTPGAPETITPPYEAYGDTRHYDFTELPNDAYGIFYDDRPPWDVSTPDNPSRYATGQHPPLGSTGSYKNQFRSIFEGAGRLFRGKRPRADYMIPSETVNEGWLNKPNEGPVAVADPSSWEQYERQTSMQQRFKTQDNSRAVERGTDPVREPIPSRVVRQRSPVYSGEKRHVDMFPYQQTPERERRFYYRTAGTGYQQWMQSNEMYDIEALERTPPADPYIGQADTQVQYGYTPEDNFYA